ncbi:hypothetical protein C162_26005 [Paenibacillus sp. FSL R7-269]|uniref:hypothetical protein n=1 Tax=Paenibacillus sp. FSL R7-269 TaxID=1226755 RepID=UPI0003E210DD|nr:hypothetical protein [Paenibacillus sp. FSL R7-269]ETT41592.1 hypothetical protein C162_26005 [Paenibacillus sp. FSL R7-269]
MKIKITGAQKETFWYADKVGQIFEIDGHVCSYAGYRICGKTPNGNEGYVQLKDCVIVPDEADSAPITVLPDESLGGVLREYREVKRKAIVGERIKVTSDIRFGERRAGGIHTVTRLSSYGLVDTDGKWGDGSTLNLPADEYVVLEASDIIRIDDKDGVSRAYRMVDRKAAVGERVIITKGNLVFNVGQAATVHESAIIEDDGICFLDGCYGTYPNGKYAVLEPAASAAPTPLLSDQPAESQAVANVASLVLRLTQAEAKITTLESAIKALTERKVASGPVDTTLPSFAGLGVMKSAAVKEAALSPQETRDEIVERAKADVEALLNRNYPSREGYSPSLWFTEGGGVVITDTCEFIVNREKRTVVALIKGISSQRVFYRGKARCAPGETFNAAIGRAISLRRALGLAVPAEYLNAPGPTEVRVGDIVTGKSASFTIVNDIVSDRDKLSLKFANSQLGKPLRITDDSREDGGQSAASSALKGAA